jgi:TerC family integral membrane protein
MIETIGNGWMWAGFVGFIGVMVAIDMLLLGRQGAHRVSAREAGAWSALWIVLALTFNGVLWWWLDGQLGRDIANQKALEFLTGYLVEKALAVDNIFVFVMIFGYFAVPAEYQRRVLVYGVLGAIVLRAAMILAGAVLIARFHWVLYVFGALLVFTGLRMMMAAEQAPDLAKNPVLRWLRGHLRVTDAYHGDRFTVRHNGVRYVTPLFLVLVMIELSDVVFAVDSIPAIFAITRDPFIVFTSNMFAILGLRAMYFLLAGMAQRFRLLKYGLALILVLIGAKMLVAELYKLPVGVALGLVALILAASVLASLWQERRGAA